jgi:hypothetical protein
MNGNEPSPEAIRAAALAAAPTREAAPFVGRLPSPEAIAANPVGVTTTAPIAQGEQGDAYPTGSDREVLLYLMQQFDTESWECPRCGEEDACADMDSAAYLRHYLERQPASPAEPVAKIRWDGGENYAVHVLRPEAFADGLPHLMCEALTAAKAAQPESVKPCTDERACVNCYSGQGACLIDGHTESAAPGAVDEDTIRCTIDEGFGRYWLTMGMGERDRARAFVTRLLTAALAKPDGPRMGGGE